MAKETLPMKRMALSALVFLSACSHSSGGSRPPPSALDLVGETATYFVDWTSPTSSARGPATMSGRFDGDVLTLTLQPTYPCGDARGIGECDYDEATGDFSCEVIGAAAGINLHVEGRFAFAGQPAAEFQMVGTYSFSGQTCFPSGDIVLNGPIPLSLVARELRPRVLLLADEQLVGAAFSDR